MVYRTPIYINYGEDCGILPYDPTRTDQNTFELQFQITPLGDSVDYVRFDTGSQGYRMKEYSLLYVGLTQWINGCSSAGTIAGYNLTVVINPDGSGSGAMIIDWSGTAAVDENGIANTAALCDTFYIDFDGLKIGLLEQYRYGSISGTCAPTIQMVFRFDSKQTFPFNSRGIFQPSTNPNPNPAAKFKLVNNYTWLDYTNSEFCLVQLGCSSSSNSSSSSSNSSSSSSSSSNSNNNSSSSSSSSNSSGNSSSSSSSSSSSTDNSFPPPTLTLVRYPYFSGFIAENAAGSYVGTVEMPRELHTAFTPPAGETMTVTIDTGGHRSVVLAANCTGDLSSPPCTALECRARCNSAGDYYCFSNGTVYGCTDPHTSIPDAPIFYPLGWARGESTTEHGGGGGEGGGGGGAGGGGEGGGGEGGGEGGGGGGEGEEEEEEQEEGERGGGGNGAGGIFGCHVIFTGSEGGEIREWNYLGFRPHASWMPIFKRHYINITGNDLDECDVCQAFTFMIDPALNMVAFGWGLPEILE